MVCGEFPESRWYGPPEPTLENIMKYLSLCSGIGGIERAADIVNELEEFK